ncbi:hypothetical protein SH661x_002976 [Planctomicrobium sp. SH661]|uniref:hypothetical protein n=1 Tax=Planctomicrobium sp. SH661 TaxID=3448124 RepID=UPI003F5B0876
MTIEMQQRYHALNADAIRLAGGLTDLTQRAAVYRHVYLESGRNHVFPLIAAHGALWAGGYFRFGMRLGGLLNGIHRCSEQAVERMERLADFADEFREINWRVCVDTYVNFVFTREFGHHPAAGQFVVPELLDQLNRVHDAERTGTTLSDAEKEEVFTAHFLYEQEHIVGPRLQQGVDEFEWPLMKSIALRPWIRFSYFPAFTILRFRDFTSSAERIRNGLRAFEVASRVGWDPVEAALEKYGTLPAESFINPGPWFERFRAAILSTDSATSLSPV